MNSTIILFIFCLSTILVTGCKKDNIKIPEPYNSAPVVKAGPDQIYSMLASHTTLSGSVEDREGNIKSVMWKKVTGPDSFLIENETAVFTKIKNLVQGVYQFELTAWDTRGLLGKDTVIVIIGDDPTKSEVIFRGLEWTTPWYNSIEVKKFTDMFPMYNLEVFIQRETDMKWENVAPAWTGPITTEYEYFIKGFDDGSFYHMGSLYVIYYGDDISDKPSIRIKLL